MKSGVAVVAAMFTTISTTSHVVGLTAHSFSTSLAIGTIEIGAFVIVGALQPVLPALHVFLPLVIAIPLAIAIPLTMSLVMSFAIPLTIPPAM